MLSITKISATINYILLVIVFFSLFYDVSFVAFPVITSGRIALIFLLMMNYKDFRSIRLSRKIVQLLFVIFILFSAVLVQFYYSADMIQVSRIVWFVFYSIFAPLLIVRKFSNLNSFLICVCITTSIQSISAINAFVNPDFKNWILSNIVVGGNDIEEVIYRAISMTSTSGAALSIIQFCGLYSGLYLLRFSKFSISNQIFLVFSILLNLIGTMIIGRTGLLLSLFSIFIFIISTLKIKTYVLISLIAVVSTQFNYIEFIETQTESVQGFKVEFFINWLEDGLKAKENSTVSTLQNMPVPPLKLNTILGTGQVFNVKTGKNASGNDSGYVQTYFSMGIVLCIVFYLSYFLFLWSYIPKTNRWFHILLFVYLISIEVKEPFIFKYVFPFFIFSFFLLERKNSHLLS